MNVLFDGISLLLSARGINERDLINGGKNHQEELTLGWHVSTLLCGLDRMGLVNAKYEQSLQDGAAYGQSAPQQDITVLW